MPVRIIRGDASQGPDDRGWWRVVLVFSLFLPLVAPAADDEYLKLLQAEAQKLSTPEPGEALQTRADTDATNDIGSFEEELKNHYRGSYLFYEKLSRNSQEEIFLDYKNGSTIDDIRKKIMNRFLRQNER